MSVFSDNISRMSSAVRKQNYEADVSKKMVTINRGLAGKNIANRFWPEIPLKCGVQHSNPAVVGRKSGSPEMTDADTCTMRDAVPAFSPDFR
ncbi:hypothetical protein [Undibacterium squillarum]|uniref:hypothetical protein n=1 Tax=Undibacterium squillarum TaxID=1131567 RepID=UPI0035B1FCCF